MLISELFPQRLADCFDHTVRVLKHIVVPEAQHLKPLRFEPRRPVRILLHLLGMLATIHLNYEFVRQAHKVDNIVAQWDLTPKTKFAQLMPAQTGSKMLFRVGLIAT